MTQVEYEKGDIVLVRSLAGSAIPPFHVKLLNRVIVAASTSRNSATHWPGYSGWEATPIYQKEVDLLRKEWQISFRNANKDLTFIFDHAIIKKMT